MEKDREISNSIAKDYVKENKMLYFEVSAKTGYNIEEMFSKLCVKVYLNCNEINLSNRLNLINQNIDLKNDSCC